MKNPVNIQWKVFLISVLLLPGCDDGEFLEKDPYGTVSQAAFWNNANDAHLALMGLYNNSSSVGDVLSGWQFQFMMMNCSGDLNVLGVWGDPIIGNMSPATQFTASVWQGIFRKVARTNYFIENIDRVDMNENDKVEMKAEARFIRAFCYFYGTQFWGDFPLVTKLLTIPEANSVSRDPKQVVVDFVLSELSEAANGLPVTRPDSELGRAEKGAALAMKGRLLMAEERWSEAVSTYEEIMDLGYSIDPRYRTLFLEEGETSPEIILSTNYINSGSIGGYTTSWMSWPFSQRGRGNSGVNNSMVETYECTDGLPIDESPLYDPENPFENRDPRLYASVLLPNYSTIDGELFVTHPDSVNSLDKYPTGTPTGYGIRKNWDENYEGGVTNYGGDAIRIRYAEVLLSYLESKLEAGDPIDQDLLDRTINMVRGRAEVSMPPVTETNPDALRTILRRERRVEFFLEYDINYWDKLRWRTAHIAFNGPVYGSKICDSPANCDFTVDDRGHIQIGVLNFRENVDYLWPVPQNEMDISVNLDQNPGYQ